jgi:hypothetical protein
MAVGAVSAVPVLAPNLLHVVEKRNIQRERKRKIYFMTISTVYVVPVFTPTLLHVVEKRISQREFM